MSEQFNEGSEVVAQPTQADASVVASEPSGSTQNNEVREKPSTEAPVNADASVSTKPIKKEFTQAEIDHIVIKAKEQAKRQGYESARKELMEKISPPAAPEQQVQANPDYYKGYQDAERALAQKTLEARDTAAAQHFASKINVAPDTKEATAALEFFGEFESDAMLLVHQLNSVENTADVFNYLNDNKKAKQEIKNLLAHDVGTFVSSGRKATSAHDKLLEIAERLKQNADAPTIKANNPRPPKGNDIKPSTIALGEKTQLKVSDIIKGFRRN